MSSVSQQLRSTGSQQKRETVTDTPCLETPPGGGEITAQQGTEEELKDYQEGSPALPLQLAF